MAYESFNYDIKDRLPEWWKNDTFLTPINRYTQELIRDLIGGLLGNFGAVQPFQIWKTLPTEYSYVHRYYIRDPLLTTEDGEPSPLVLYPSERIYAYLPNSKRNCHGVIQLRLNGIREQEDYDEKAGRRTIKVLKQLKLTNGNQTITFNNISTVTDIKIFTEDGTILVDGVPRDDLVKGSFNKIYPQAKNLNYNEVDVDDENKITRISIEATMDEQIEQLFFDLQIKLIHPIYVTEQNMRIHTVSAFPIEWVKLYGFFCHDYNNKQEWRFLWEKHYRKKDRVVYDRITKQFDCETFYMQVKLYGIGVPYTYGFPQSDLSNDATFQTNKNLDKWGRIYSLPRRYYKTQISEEEEPYTFPPYYNYDIEQDFWYEERLVNEYRHNDDAINAALIKDTNLNNIGILKCIDPSIHDIYVYTETIKHSINNEHQTDKILPTYLSEEGEGVTWQTPHEVANSNITAAKITLQPQTSETFNTKENQTKTLEIFFDKEDIPELPKNIEITGIELQLNGLTDVHSDSLILDDRSQMLLPTTYTKENGEVFTTIDNIQINNDIYYWEKGKGTYTIGGQNNLFNLSEIKREQLQQGLTFNIGFTNLNTFLKTTIVLYSINLIIYYKIIHDSYDINIEMDNREIILTDPEKQNITMKIHLKNTGLTPIIDKKIHIVSNAGIDITNTSFPLFDLDIGESFTIGNLEEDKIIITSANQKTGLYDIVVFCDDKVISNEISIREFKE